MPPYGRSDARSVRRWTQWSVWLVQWLVCVYRQSHTLTIGWGDRPKFLRSFTNTKSALAQHLPCIAWCPFPAAKRQRKFEHSISSPSHFTADPQAKSAKHSFLKGGIHSLISKINPPSPKIVRPHVQSFCPFCETFNSSCCGGIPLDSRRRDGSQLNHNFGTSFQKSSLELLEKEKTRLSSRKSACGVKSLTSATLDNLRITEQVGRHPIVSVV